MENFSKTFVVLSLNINFMCSESINLKVKHSKKTKHF